MDFQKIASAQNNQLKYVAQLQKKNRFRNGEGKIVLEGFHLLQEAFKSNSELIESIFIDSKQLQNPESKILNQLEVPVYVLHNDLISKISSTHSSSGIVSIAKRPAEIRTGAQNLVLFIENLQDPGNLGTIIRSSAAAGVDAIFIDRQSVDIWSSKVLRAGMGSHFKLNINLTDRLEENIQDFPGSAYITAMDGQNLFKTALPKQTAFIIGNEGQGVSENLQKQVADKIHIPMQAQVESLNVSTATTLCLYEYYRQHIS